MSTLAQVYRQLDELGKAGLQQSFPTDLWRVYRLLERLGNPHAAFPSIIVTGSKGKGSTATFLAASLSASRQAWATNHHRVPAPSSFIPHPSSLIPSSHPSPLIGLFTGPHLHTFRERTKLNGVEIGVEDFTTLFDEVRAEAERDPAGEFISRFETITVMAFLYFARAGIDLAILEVGMGGRYDAVNTALNSPLSIFTPIEMEHVRNLGPTQADIVHHKAGIMRMDGQAIMAHQARPVHTQLLAEAQKLNVALKAAADYWRYREGTLALHCEAGKLWQTFEATGPDSQIHQLQTMAGTFQIENALTALAAHHRLYELGRCGPPDPAALRQAFIPGRLEVARQDPLVILDGAHTPNAMRELWRTLAKLDGTPIWVLAFLRDKDFGEMLRMIPLTDRAVFLPAIHKQRKASVEVIQASLQEIPARVETDLSLPQAIEAACQLAAETPGGYVVITGSLYLVAEARACLGLLDPATAAEAALEGEG